MDSVFDDGASSDFAPPVKPAKAAKPKAAATKKTAGPAKPRGRPAKDATQAKPKVKAAPKKKRKADSEDDENSDVDMDEVPFGDDESLLADTPPQRKKAPGPKKTSGKPLADIPNESFGMDGVEESPFAKPSKKGAGGASGRYQMARLSRSHLALETNGW